MWRLSKSEEETKEGEREGVEVGNGERLRQRKALAKRVNRPLQQGTCADWLTSQVDILFSNERRL